MGASFPNDFWNRGGGWVPTAAVSTVERLNPNARNWWANLAAYFL